jgi:hypothetical protein
MRKHFWFFVAALMMLSIYACTGTMSRTQNPQYTGLGESEGPPGPAFTPSGEAPPRPDAPVITNAYAINKGIYGTILKIYLEADDPAGEMDRIAVTVDQTGYGHYPTDFIYLKPEYRNHFKGYIQWNTFSSHASRLQEWQRIYVRVSVIDKSGRESNEFGFPFTFETGVRTASAPPAPFAGTMLAKLGNINIDLYNPTELNDRDRRD